MCDPGALDVVRCFCRAMLLGYDQEGTSVQQVAGQDGLYRMNAGDRLFNKVHVLEAGMPPIPGALDEPGSYGFVSRGLPTPGTGGSYVVALPDKLTVRVLAYIDPYGRVFSTSEALSAPPARQPDLSFARYSDQASSSREERGCVYVHEKDAKREVAQYLSAQGRYALFDSWYDFGPYAGGLRYDHAMARAYLAFVHRPSLGAPAVPERGLESVFEHLRGDKPLAAMRSIVLDARKAESDPAFRPPALVRCLAQWLEDAGLDDLKGRGMEDESVRLMRTSRYADTYYVAVDDEEARIPVPTIWALEAALNRFLLVKEAFGDRAAFATDVDCARWDAYLIEAAAVQRPQLDRAVDAPEGNEGGEWDARCRIAAAIERLRLPFRIDASFRLDVAAGAVAFDVTVPDALLMPTWVWSEGVDQDASGSWLAADWEFRDAQARRYALHLGLVLVSIAFEAVASASRVDVAVRPLSRKQGDQASEGGEFPHEDRAPAYVQAAFDRATYERFDGFEQARAFDPLPAYQACAACFDGDDAQAFAYLEGLASSSLRADLPETCDKELSDSVRSVLGADSSRDMRISYDAAYRRLAEGLADRIVQAESASDAIRIVRAAQEEAAAASDDRAVSSCTRLMAALAAGSLDARDQNVVVGRYLGEDRCLVALGRAKALAEHDLGQAVDVLIDAVAEAAALDGFVDGSSTAYRAFDSYVARVLYNRARYAGAGYPSRAVRDAGKRVRLATDTFYLCHLEIVRLLEHSFERADEAQRYGRRAVEIAPATAAGYRQLGRAYMLVGDMENASATLLEGLRIAFQPSDIAMAYYQLAYVLWKMGRARDGAACYLKSLATSSMVAVQATAELQELVGETGIDLPARDQVDLELTRAGIPVAPTSDVLDALDEAAVAATDEGMFRVARSLMAARSRYRPDDALVNVLRSLESS